VQPPITAMPPIKTVALAAIPLVNAGFRRHRGLVPDTLPKAAPPVTLSFIRAQCSHFCALRSHLYTHLATPVDFQVDIGWIVGKFSATVPPVSPVGLAGA
jgi:hypothetical protein